MTDLHLGDCLERLREIAPDSIDALVTDPPAGISFMGKAWDNDKGGRKEWVAWMTEVMRECHRVLKPGAHGLVWALPRTSHWTATALEDAGFEVRDVVTHLFGSGFPKSLDVSKAIDKAAGAEREVIGRGLNHHDNAKRSVENSGFSGSPHDYGKDVAGWSPLTAPITAPATEAAKKWQGWGTSLKPASEHWVLVRKPCSEKTVAANVLLWSTGALNIDASRIEGGPRPHIEKTGAKSPGTSMDTCHSKHMGTFNLGRFPANLVLSHSPHCTDDQCDIECAAKALDEQSGMLKSGSISPHHGGKMARGITGKMQSGTKLGSSFSGDSGGASRFFLCVKYDTQYECGLKNTKGDDTFVGKNQENKSGSLSTDGFGSKPTDQFLMGTISITEMGTHSIMTFPILSAFTKTFIGTITIESGKTIESSLVESVVGVSVVSATEALLHFQSGQPEPITGIVSLASDSTLLAGVIETASTGTRTIGNIVASRFLYCAKISKSERGEGNNHPTVKPQKLMQYLIRMITPPNGVVLDPFMGSGSTGVACKSAQHPFIGIEKESEYFEIAKRRVAHEIHGD